MATISNKAVVVSASITFGSTTYDCKSLPAGIPESTELPDVTVLTDDEQKFAESACTEDGEIQVVVAGTAPAINAKGTLTISLNVSVAGATATAQAVSVGSCIVTGVEPSTLEAGGDRVQTWTVTFRPDGSRS